MTTAAESSALTRLADVYWEAWLERHPVAATAIGDRRFDARMGDETPAGRDEWRRQLDRFETELAELDQTEDFVTAAVLADEIDGRRARLDADLVSFNVDPLDGPQARLLDIPSYQPIRHADDADALLARWRAMAPFLDELGDNLRAGLAAGRVAVRAPVAKVIEQLDELLARPDADWPLMEPAEGSPAMRDELAAVVRDDIRPAFARYRSLLADEIAPAARPDDRPGLVHVPGGERAYRRLMRAHTSLELEPERVHDIGLEEIRRIDAEFVELGERLLRTNGLATTLEALRSDPALRFDTREEVEAVARASLDRANAAIGDWF